MPVYIFASAQYQTKSKLLSYSNVVSECLQFPTLKDLEEFFKVQEKGEIVGKVVIMGFTKLTKKEYETLRQ
jgi:hypothetical protein